MFIPGFRSEISFGSDWYLGLGLRRYDLGIITGYDRYNSLERDDFTEIGEITEASLYTGWRNDVNEEGHWVGDLRFGINFNTYDSKNKYKNIDVDLNPISFFVGMNVGYGF